MSKIKSITVVFGNHRDMQARKEYTYPYTLKEDIKPWDIVLVQTYYGPQIATVRTVSQTATLASQGYDAEEKAAVLEILQSKEMDKLNMTERMKQIKERIKQRAKKIDERKVYEAYAKEDKEIAAMIEEMKQLEG